MTKKVTQLPVAPSIEPADELMMTQKSSGLSKKVVAAFLNAFVLSNWEEELQIVASHVSAGILPPKGNSGDGNIDKWVSFGANTGAPQLAVSKHGLSWSTQSFPAGPLTAFTSGIRVTEAHPVDTIYLLGSTNGRVIRATDLSDSGNWALVTSQLEGVGVVSGFAQNASGSVVVAFSDQSGANSFIRSSNGGSTWLLKNSNLTDPIVSVVWHAPISKFVAISSTGEVTTSPGGSVWTQAAEGPDDTLLSNFASGNGLLVAIQSGTGDKRVYQSTDDGVSWSSDPFDDENDDFLAFEKNQLIFVDELGLFIVVGGLGQIASSSDAADNSWKRHVVTTSDISDWAGIAFGQRRLMMTGFDFSTRGLAISGSDIDA